MILDLGPRHLEHLDTIVDPLVITDLTTVVWAPHGHWRAVEALRGMSQCVLLDSTEDPDVAGALRRAQTLLADRYVVDLAWLRSTPWRERIAMVFDRPARRARLAEIERRWGSATPPSRGPRRCSCAAGCARGCGWPQGAARPRRPRPRDRHDGRRRRAARLRHARRARAERGHARIPRRRRALARSRPRRSARDEPRRRDGERRWTLLGASRGEGGILGEGMRQSLLRDRTYREALDAAAGDADVNGSIDPSPTATSSPSARRRCSAGCSTTRSRRAEGAHIALAGGTTPAGAYARLRARPLGGRRALVRRRALRRARRPGVQLPDGRGDAARPRRAARSSTGSRGSAAPRRPPTPTTPLLRGGCRGRRRGAGARRRRCSESARTATPPRSSPAIRRSRCAARSVVAVHDAPKPPPDRVSLTLEVLRAARSCVLLASGAGKAAPLARVLERPRRPDDAGEPARRPPPSSVVADAAALGRG